MRKKKITAIMAVIMMAAGLSACSQSNAKLEGKSGIVKDEDSKTERLHRQTSVLPILPTLKDGVISGRPSILPLHRMLVAACMTSVPDWLSSRRQAHPGGISSPSPIDMSAQIWVL